jgi:NitT/TauT family transport system substrate-binding protein
MKTRGLSTILAALAISAAGFAGPAAADDTISCAYPFWPGFAPVHLANEMGYFAEEGLTVNETFDDDRSNVLPALERGDIQCDMRTVGEHQGRPRTPETQGTIVGTIDISLGGDGVVADGSIKTAADLKGKVFAAEPNVPARLLAQLAPGAWPDLRRSGGARHRLGRCHRCSPIRQSRRPPPMSRR